MFQLDINDSGRTVPAQVLVVAAVLFHYALEAVLATPHAVLARMVSDPINWLGTVDLLRSFLVGLVIWKLLNFRQGWQWVGVGLLALHIFGELTGVYALHQDAALPAEIRDRLLAAESVAGAVTVLLDLWSIRVLLRADVRELFGRARL